jgi:SPP1 gp7 family putative phage head morphogenesis protein
MPNIGDKIENIIRNLQLPQELTSQIINTVSKNFDLGVENIEKLIDKNILDINPEVIQNLKEYNFDLIKDVNADLAGKLRSTIERHLIDGTPKTKLIKDVRKIFDASITRARTIAVTETHRAFAVGQLEAAKKSPVTMRKYIMAVNDNRTSALCTRLSNKYNRANAIPINRNFKDNQTGGIWKSNPFHPNCRSRVVYIPVEK